MRTATTPPCARPKRAIFLACCAIAAECHAGATFYSSYTEWSVATSGDYDTLDSQLGSLQFLSGQYATYGVHCDGITAPAGPVPSFFPLDSWGIGSAAVPNPIIPVAPDGDGSPSASNSSATYDFRSSPAAPRSTTRGTASTVSRRLPSQVSSSPSRSTPSRSPAATSPRSRPRTSTSATPSPVPAVSPAHARPPPPATAAVAAHRVHRTCAPAKRASQSSARR